MGCHAWFYKPVTDAELKVFHENAIADAWNLYGKTEENLLLNYVKTDEFNKVKKSVLLNTDYWWKAGYGTRIGGKYEYTNLIEGKLYLDLSNNSNCIFDLRRYHDVFRVKNYSTKNIHNRRELRKWMGKRYFELEDWQLEKVSEFFGYYHDAIITFG